MELPNIERKSQHEPLAAAFVDATTTNETTAEILTTRVCGEELFLHAAQAAALAESVGRVVVVCTSGEIHRIAKQKRFDVLLLQESNSSASIVDRVFNSADVSAAGLEPIVVSICANAPLLAPEDIDRFVKQASQTPKTAVFSALQSARREFVDSGALYAFSRAEMLRAGALAAMQLSPGFLPAFHGVRVRDLCDLQPLSALLQRKPLAATLQQQAPAALVLDFDGVFTDNKVIVSADGQESAICDRSDGFAIQSLQRRGFPILVLSTEKVPIVRARSEKLGLQCIHGVGDKRSILTAWLKERDIDPRLTIYVGNDVNDLECMEMVGLPVAVADAFPEVLAAARCVLRARGGHGAVREIATAVAAALHARE